MWSQRPCDSLRNALTNYLYEDMSDEGWKVLVSQKRKRRGGFVFEFAVDRWTREVSRKIISRYWAKSFGYRIGISDSFQSLEGIEIVN